LLFDYNYTKENVIPQFEYIGTQYTSELRNQTVAQAKSLTDFEREPQRDFGWMQNELSEERFVNTNLMPENNSKYRKKINIKIDRMTTRDAPVFNQLLLDAKPTNLHYDVFKPE
jgi:hypothetical protein